MKAYFITGIGTGVGKTFITAALTHQLREAGHDVQAFKPVMSGYEAASSSDAGVLLAAMGKPISEETIAHISPWRFAAPLSPHLAAMQEGRKIDPQALIDWSTDKTQSSATVLIEGAGGVMVPLHERFLVLDWMHKLHIPVIVVSSSYLGAINHTLLSLVVLRQAGLTIRGVVVSQSAVDDAGLEATCDTICTILDPEIPVVPIKRVQDSDNAWKKVPDLLSLVS